MTKRMKNATGPRVALGAVLGLLAAFASTGAALGQSADCARLRQAIADAPRNDQGAQYQAAAARQRGELDRTTAYAHPPSPLKTAPACPACAAIPGTVRPAWPCKR